MAHKKRAPSGDPHEKPLKDHRCRAWTGLGLFSVSASAVPASGVAFISKVNHLPDAADLPIEHVQFPCIFPFPCGYG